MRKGVRSMNYDEDFFKANQGYLLKIEHTLRHAENMMRDLFPNYDIYNEKNAERFIISCVKANEALRQIQDGNMETVHKYWRKDE
jgi:hypothetical protein